MLPKYAVKLLAEADEAASGASAENAYAILRKFRLRISARCTWACLQGTSG